MKGSTLLILTAIAAGCWLGGQAHAAVNLPLTCAQAGITGTQACGSGSRVFAAPAAATMVSTGTTTGWVRFDALTAVHQVLVCANDVPSPTPTDGCPADKKVSVSPCLVAGAATLSLCGKAANSTGIIELTWVAPTHNTNGSALADLAGYKVFSGTSAANLTLKQQVAKGVTSLTLSGYTDGTYYFGVTALNAAGAESAMSTIASRVVKLPTTPVPNPPTNLTTKSEQVAYRVDLELTQDQPRLFVVGKVPAGTTCNRSHTFMVYNRVDAAAVILNAGARRPKNAWTKCG